MKKRMILLTVFVLMVSLAGAASAASGLDALKNTFTVGPFEVKDLGFVLKQTEDTVETTNGLYGLKKLDKPGKTDEETIAALADAVRKSEPTVETYENANGVQGLYYVQDVGGSQLLTIMMVHGSDCLVAVLSQSPETEIESFYAHYLMDDYALVSEE